MPRGNVGGDKPSPEANSVCMGPPYTVNAMRARFTPTLCGGSAPPQHSLPTPSQTLACSTSPYTSRPTAHAVGWYGF